MKKIFSLLVLFYMALSTLAHDFELDGIYYNILDEHSVEVTYKGDDHFEDEYFSYVEIPEKIVYNGTHYRVMKIGDMAFTNCELLNSVKIPKSVKSIGNSAFSECTCLASIDLPDSLTSIGSCAFMQCFCLTSMVVPESVTSIGYQAFCLCTLLKSITLSTNLDTIGIGLFNQCTSLLSITIPNNVTIIKQDAFRGCNSLASVKMSDNLVKIGDNAFYDCASLTNIILGDEMKEIGNNAFEGCTALTSINIGKKIEKIGAAFRNCYRLDTISCHAITPPTLHKLAFVNRDATTRYEAKLYVPCEALEDYQQHEIWGQFNNVICINDSTTTNVENHLTKFNTKKIIKDNQLKILCNGVEYDIMGNR